MKVEFEDALFGRHLEKALDDEPIAHFSLKAFDELVGGVRPRMTIIAGEPGTGKTSLLLQLADDIARQGMPALFVSLEIAPPQLIAKSLARMSGGELSVTDISRATQQAGEADARRESLSRAIRHYQQLIAPHVAFGGPPPTPWRSAPWWPNASGCARRSRWCSWTTCRPSRATPRTPTSALPSKGIDGVTAPCRELPRGAALRHQLGQPHELRQARHRPQLSRGKQRSGILQRLRGVPRHRRQRGGARRTNMSRPIRRLLTMLKNRYGTCDETTLLYDAEHATFAEVMSARRQLVLAERVRCVREASAFMETGRSTWAGASVAASNSSCDTRCDTPDEKAASEATLDGAGGLRAAIRNALRPLAARPPEADAGPGEPEPDGVGPVPRIQEPVDMEETAQATRTISVRLTDDDF